MTTTVNVDPVKRTLTVASDQFNSAAQIVLGADTVPFPIPKNSAQWTGVTPTLVTSDNKLPSTTNVYSF